MTEIHAATLCGDRYGWGVDARLHEMVETLSFLLRT